MLANMPQSLAPHAKWLEGSLPCRTEGSLTIVGLPGGPSIAANMLESPKVKPVIEAAFSALTPCSIKLRFEVTGPAPTAIPTGPKKDVYADPAVRRVMDAFDGGIIHVEQNRP